MTRKDWNYYNEIICKKTGKKYSGYHNYLNSKEWQSKRAEAFKKNGFCCFFCKSKKNLEIHHKTYKRLGNERVNDLMVLCKECHKKIIF